MVFPALILLLMGCSGPVTFSTRLYNIGEPQVLTVTWHTPKKGSGRGTMACTGLDGEIFKGEWVTISGASYSESYGNTTGSGSTSIITKNNVGFSNQWGWASSFGFTLNNPGVQNGSFIMQGDKGTVINGVYQINPAAGEGLLGAAEDNKGRKYKVMG